MGLLHELLSGHFDRLVVPAGPAHLVDRSGRGHPKSQAIGESDQVGRTRQLLHGTRRTNILTGDRGHTELTHTPLDLLHTGRVTAEDDRIPIDQVLPGFKIHPLDEGWTPLAAFVVLKSLDEDGETAWSFRTSERFNLEELLGALVVQTEVLRRKLARLWDDEDVDD
jgi:hypothetical protein